MFKTIELSYSINQLGVPEKMINKREAEKIAQGYVDVMSKEAGFELALFTETIKEFGLGWVFHYNSKKFIDTDSFEDMLVGDAPFLVTKSAGEIIKLGTAYSVEHYITELEKSAE